MRAGILIAILLCTSGGAALNAYTTEKVIVILMGGVRNTEAFEDPTHQYIPRIWENISPYGVIYDNFYTLAETRNSVGAFTTFMGVRRNENNTGTTWHGLSPTMFEYFRMQHSLPEDKVWIVSNEHNNAFGVNHSLHPAFGSTYAASRWGSPHFSDIETFEETIRVMNQYAPRLLAIRFNEPDEQAQHGGDPELPDSIAWENYTRAIVEVDSLIDLIWTKVQIDTAYAGKTTLFITSAHGRHSPLYGDFEWHGDSCNGCRRLPFLAAGPDFKQGEVVNTRGDLIDICPTVGELIDFDPLFAEGRVLSELFLVPPGSPSRHSGKNFARAQKLHEDTRLSPPGVHSHSPEIDITGNELDVIWTQRNLTTPLEAWDIMHTQSTDAGMTWTVPLPVFSTNEPNEKVVTVASLSGDTTASVSVNSYYQWNQYWHGDSAWIWGGECKVRLHGAEWPDTSTRLLQYVQPSMIDNVPAICLSDTAIAAVFLNEHWNRRFALSRDLGMSWIKREVDVYTEHMSSPNTPSIVIGDRLYYVESLRYEDKSRLPLFSQQSSEIVLTGLIDDISGHEAFFPQLAYGDSTVYCVWSDDREGHWEVYFSRSEDAGTSWSSNLRLSQGGVNTWHTAIEAEGDTLLVVWEDYRDGASSLYKRVSFDGGEHWSEEYVEEAVAGISTYPKLAHSAGNYYMVWQDYRSGEWEVYFKQVNIDVPVGIEDGDHHDPSIPRVMALSQNYPNPFNPQTVIAFDVPGREQTRVTLGVYDLRGSLVKELVDKPLAPGHYELLWNATDHRGSDVASGIYLYTIDIKNEKITRKMTLAR
jgi:hypothetical protein